MAHATVAQLYQYLAQVSKTPDTDALFQVLLDRASAIVDDELFGVTLPELEPVPLAVEQVTLELAVNMWRSVDRGLWADSSGAAGEGELPYVNGLTPQQTARLLQVRWRFDGSVV